MDTLEYQAIQGNFNSHFSFTLQEWLKLSWKLKSLWKIVINVISVNESVINTHETVTYQSETVINTKL